MGRLQLLDCTLREAPIDNLMWGEMNIHKMIHGLEVANVDIIECGFLKDADYIKGSTSFQRVEDIIPFLKNKKKGKTYVALVDYGRYDLKYLSEYDGRSIDAIRVCFKKNEIGLVLDYAAQIHAKGYQVCVQHVDTMGFSDEEIIDFIKKVNEFKPLAYSVVDTFGAMYEEDMLHYTGLADQYLSKDILLGFHAHNNLMLADANAQSYINKMSAHRDVVVDASLFGCGRSAGNAHTELIAQFINKKHEEKYNIDELLDLIDTVIASAQEVTSWGYSIPYFIAGIYNAHTYNVKQLLKRHNIKSKDLRGIIELLDNVQKKKYDYALLEKLYVEYFDNPVTDALALEKLSNTFKNRNILLLAPGKSVAAEKEHIQKFIDEKKTMVIAVNNVISGYQLDYIFYSSTNRYNLRKFQECAPETKVIVTSNIQGAIEEDTTIVNYSSLIKFGWVNLDSSAILLLRLLIRCGVEGVYVAGLDGYRSAGDTFYKNDLETGVEDKDRQELTRENTEMIADIVQTNPEFEIHFITQSEYSKALE